MSDNLQAIDEGLWTLTGTPITFLGFPFQLRSTIVDLGHALLVHSPIQVEAARSSLSQLGSVEHIVSPNKLHHLFFGEWQSAYPNARLYAPPGLIEKRPDIRFAGELGNSPESPWAATLDQRIVSGSFFMDEVVFFHRPSRSLILGDLIENHDPRDLNPLQRVVARANAVLAPNGSTGRNYRLTFFKRAKARRTVEEILSWKPQRVVLTHSPPIEHDATEFLRAAFAWLL